MRQLTTICLAIASLMSASLSFADNEVPAAARPATSLAPALLQSGELKVGTVWISSNSIFDLDDPAENRFLYRLANRLHITTWPQVVEQQLLFAPGDDFSLQALEESERLLRSNRFIQTVDISPVRIDGHSVDIEVVTRDTWTLMPKLSFSRSGGVNDFAFGIKEMNLLGTGVAIEAQYKSDVDRDSRILKLANRNIGDSWYQVQTVLASNSDGHSYGINVGKPFYALDSRHALELDFLDNDEIDSYYDLGEIYSAYRRKMRAGEVSRGWSRGLQDGRSRRFVAGFAYDDRQFSAAPGNTDSDAVIPDDLRLAYPFVGVQLLQDKFAKISNLEQIERTEDIYLGSQIAAHIGYSSTAVGADRDALVFAASAGTGLGDPQGHVLLLESDLTGRVEAGGMRNLLWSAAARYYHRQSERRLLFASVSTSFGTDLDQDEYLVLGGETGLRGYPLRYQSGARRALVSIEQRYFSDWYPFRLFNVGAALFCDVGRAWGDSPVPRSSNEVLWDVGAGLRIGSARSGLGRMLHLDVAVPLNGGPGLDGVQFLVSTRKSF